jgi:hypothetical protein
MKTKDLEKKTPIEITKGSWKIYAKYQSEL